MCGIAGWVSFQRGVGSAPEAVGRMTETQRLRGPDDAGTWSDATAALGHRRLSVLDLEGGTQPMTHRDPSGEVVLVYSGETYNYRELRRELETRGHRFHTTSDTEVVLRAYLEWGDAAPERLNGMFAFALWDQRERRLLLVRDRLGIKPLYVRRTTDGVIFGSETKAILAHPEVPAVVDLAGLRELVGFTKADGWALWQGVEEVEPGTVVTLDQRGYRSRAYWTLEPRPHDDDLDTTVARVGELLGDTVERQLRADVPQCVLLSGGLDSSALTGLAASAVGAEALDTYSVDFAGYEEGFRTDEMRGTPDAPFVRDVVAHVGCRHQQVMLDSDRLSDPELRRRVVAARDIPVGLGDLDTSLYLLFSAVRERATVALSGEFADELFGGYAWFHSEAALNAGTFPWLAFHNSYCSDRTALLRPDLARALEVEDYVADEYATAIARVRHLPDESAEERRMRTVTQLHVQRLVRALLDRKDRVSMAVGLEVRVPYADHRLVEYVYNTPWSMKVADGREKSLLRQATRSRVPASVAERVKSHYPASQDERYVHALQRQSQEVLADRDSDLFQIVDRAWLRKTARVGGELDGTARTGLERVLDMYHWLDIYRPQLRLT
ncbi:asparagine synthase (glutamine-hydrolyzing) [Streptomyces sp. NPDC005438]|uniref:asparagine synthase (glutamine-hydrolyzing) n=1 Tax=Streptomyces sp. NPDC005438 TaxID=3156880 RepID=UPI0033B2B433